MNNNIAITYHLNGKQMILRFNCSDPEWRNTIKVLREQNRTFKLTYV